MHIRGLIIEGYSHTGKTSLINAIKRKMVNEKNSERNIIILGEHYTQILNLVNGRLAKLSSKEHLEVLRDRVDMINNLNQYAIEMGPAPRRSRGIFFILERFHLNHRANFEVKENDLLSKVEDDLIKLNARCILLNAQEGLEDRVKSRSVEEWLGKSDEDVKKYVENMKEIQDRYIQYSQVSRIPTTLINTDEKKWDKYAEEILRSINIDLV